MMDAAEPARKEQCESCELNSLEMSVCREIFTMLSRSGKAPTLEELALSLKKPPTEVACILDELEKKDLLVQRRGTHEIMGIYPLSLSPTEHQVLIDDGKRLFAMCAVDALGVPNMLNTDATITSQCEWCKRAVTIEIVNGEVVRTPPGILIWSPNQQKAPAAETCCPVVNFFCSDDHLEEWKTANPDLAKMGHSAPLDRAYPRIRECWKSYGQVMGTR